MKQSGSFDVIVLGAGGAGMMCASTAGQRGLNVLLLDHCEQAGKKILISGGGRCNFTNINTGADNFISANPHFSKSALKRYRPEDFISLVERYRIAWHEKTLGQLFCDDSAKNIVAMLIGECRKGNVEIRLGETIEDVSHVGNGFSVQSGGKVFCAPSLVVATGGPSIPKIGATGFAYDLARKFGLKIVEPKPALVPLKLGAGEALFRELSGVSADVIARCGDTRFREAALFTHKGLSGPSILQISSYWHHGEPIHVNFLPDLPTSWLVDAKRATPRANLKKALGVHLPGRLAEALGQRLGTDGELANMADRKLLDLAGQLADWQFLPDGTEGFAKAEVTRGGISTDELSSRTMEAKKLPGLYVIGEALDVTGWLGGYNFQWAWASGHAAGSALADKVSE